MKYKDFENIISPERMRKYNVACGGNTSKAMTLYRYNLRLSQEMPLFMDRKRQPKAVLSGRRELNYVKAVR